MFIVKYSGGIDGLQDSLRLHTDASMVSFNLALSDDSHDYRGGGTFFPLYNHTIVKIHQGDLLVHDSGIIHGGAKITRGKRYLLVGFVDLKSWKNNFLYWYRHFGTTATCVNVTNNNYLYLEQEITSRRRRNTQFIDDRDDGDGDGSSQRSSSERQHPIESKEDKKEHYVDEKNYTFQNEMNKIVCPGIRIARKIAFQHYTSGFAHFDDSNISTPVLLVLYGVIFHALPLSLAP